MSDKDMPRYLIPPLTLYLIAMCWVLFQLYKLEGLLQLLTYMTPTALKLNYWLNSYQIFQMKNSGVLHFRVVF